MSEIKSHLKRAALSDADKEYYFGEIMHVYDIVDEIANYVNSSSPANRLEYMKLTASLMEHVSDCNELLADFYTSHVKQGVTLSIGDRHKLETSIRKVFNEIKIFLEKAESLKK